MIGRALFTQSRFCPRLRFRSLSRISFQLTTKLYSTRTEKNEEERPWQSGIEQILSSVATRVITPQNAVQRMTSLTAKNGTREARRKICCNLWQFSMEGSRKSKDSAVAITEFPIQLSYQAQEDFDYPSQDCESNPVVLLQGLGSKLGRLWHDMPHVWECIYDTIYDDWPELDASDWKPRIDRYVEDIYFISLLFGSSRPPFDDLADFFYHPIIHALTWPCSIHGHEYWKIWLPAIVIQMETVGTKLKAELVDSPPLGNGYLSMGAWRQWQRKLMKIAAGETVGPELRATAKQAHGMMNIEKHITNRWWRRHRTELSEIAANEPNTFWARAKAQIINKTLAVENAEEEASAVKELPMQRHYHYYDHLLHI